MAANVVPGEQSPLKALQDSGKLQASTVKTFGNETVGIIGIDIRNSTLFSSSPDAGTDVLDEIQTTTAQAAALTDQGVNKIIVLAHVTFDNGIDWLAEIPGVGEYDRHFFPYWRIQGFHLNSGSHPCGGN